ncbi:condensation domain-containing protein [Nostoc sp.]|uniref:condensation domain-containing protein n=1 Tax=Nostoc sp. TaxID=1180 RepID=UPI002FF7B042
MTQQINYFREVIQDFSTVVDILRYRSWIQPDTKAFTFLEDGETEERTLTYQQLDQRSRAIASQLQAMGMSGERALLVYPPGLDYLTAFFGCLYAGVVAVPAYPPRNQRNTPRIQAIVSDAQAQIALTTTAIYSKTKSLLAEKQDNLQWLVTDNLAPGLEDTWCEPLINTKSLAFLQYTSGSTGIPKGVMISHGNLLHNTTMTYQFMNHSPASKFISWLPIYHDMGLIGGVLQPLYGGFSCILMSPASFLQRPYRWLKAISHYQGTTSGAPNFAYDLCIQKITPEQRATLDLTTWDVAFSGAEPVRQETLERFAATFAECGFRQEAFYPCYGMAEATLMVSGGCKTASPDVKTILKSALSQNQVQETTSQEDTQTFVSCGQTLPQQQILIVNPETLTPCPANEVGEIWVSGPSVGHGYWDRASETQETFHAYLKDSQVGPFLRTGDLGFLDDGQLFITGRAKDLIIIRGRNLYPQDIELTVESTHQSLRSVSGAAFAVEVDNQEQLCVVQELEFRAKPHLDEVIAAIRQAVAEEHEIQVYAVVLIQPGTIPKTSSGKIQRRATKANFLVGNLDVVASSINKNVEIVRRETKLQRQTLLTLTPQESQPLLESYIQQQVARVLAIANEVNPQQPLSALGLDSLKVFELKNQIELDLEVSLSIVDFFEGLSVRSLCVKILAELTAENSLPSVSLTQVEEAEVHPLSFAQQRLWFIHQLAPESSAHNIPVAIKFQGNLNIEVLAQSLNEIIKRHEILRTNFLLREGEPVQVIQKAITLSLPVADLRKLSVSDRIAHMQCLSTELTQQPFDLSGQLLLRAKVVQLTEQEYRLLLIVHHIIVDGWSMGILIRELASLYEAFSTGKPSPLPELPIQYVDFAYWQKQWLQGKRMATLLTYWKRQLGSQVPTLNLPIDQPRSAIQTFQGASVNFVLPKQVSKSIKNLSREEGVTVFMTLLAALQTLLHRYTNQDDIVVGTDVANRNRSEIEPLIGFFVNILVLRTNLSGNPSFRELLGRVREVALGAYTHQDLPFPALVKALSPERNLSQTPLFQVLFVLQNLPMFSLELPGVTLTPLKVDIEGAKFDLALFMEETEQGLVGTWNYSIDLFKPSTITLMSEHFETLLNSIVTEPDTQINSLEILTETEKQNRAVEQKQRQEAKFKKFKTIKPKTINLPTGELIKTGYLNIEETLPLVVEPTTNDLEFPEWLKTHRDFIQNQLLKHGAILFRNFNYNSSAEFEKVAQAIWPNLFGEYGDLPRATVNGKVYGSTPYPADKAILFHNESSHLQSWPLKIWFFCLQAAQQGGETPIVDCRKIYQLLNPKLRERFEQKQLMYVRNFTEGLDVSWQQFFRTTDKTVVENCCRQGGINFEWLSDHSLRTRSYRQAITQHPHNGTMVFFNQIQLHHISYLEATVQESLLSLFGEEQLPRNVYYGDGSSIEVSATQEISELYQQEKVSFPWQQGDILMLDNMLIAHGRNPYIGSRKILVAMGEMNRLTNN